MKPTNPWPRAAVIGASSGIGEAVARQLVAQGTKVALVARRAERLQALADELNDRAGGKLAFPYVHDVRNTAEVAAVFQRIAADLGGLELVVYASGIMPHGTEDYPTQEDVTAIETNFSGAVAWLNEAARRFSIARSGTVIGISSIAGDRGRAANPVYNATKAGFSSYLESLRNRLKRLGVTVLTVKPGYVRTQLIQADRIPSLLVADPDSAARDILAAARSCKRVVYTPHYWRYVAWALKLTPSTVLEHLNV